MAGPVAAPVWSRCGRRARYDVHDCRFNDNPTPDLLVEWNWRTVPARESGYIQSVDNAALMRVARDRKTIVRMERGIGEFVVRCIALVSLVLQDPLDQETTAVLQAMFAISCQRTMEQDTTFGVRQIVDVALKALSPGINDITTAVMCVDYLTAILTRASASANSIVIPLRGRGTASGCKRTRR